MLHLARASVQTTAGNLTCLLGKGLVTIQYHVPSWHRAEQLCDPWQLLWLLSSGHWPTCCPLPPTVLQQG